MFTIRRWLLCVVCRILMARQSNNPSIIVRVWPWPIATVEQPGYLETKVDYIPWWKDSLCSNSSDDCLAALCGSRNFNGKKIKKCIIIGSVWPWLIKHGFQYQFHSLYTTMPWLNQTKIYIFECISLGTKRLTNEIKSELFKLKLLSLKSVTWLQPFFYTG